jgi:phosphoribosylanthranilate isomerase
MPTVSVGMAPKIIFSLFQRAARATWQSSITEAATNIKREKYLPIFTLKICGITNADDALAAATAGADAIGLNFYPKSPRYVDFNAAPRIMLALPAGLATVGLFVNDSPERIRTAFDQLGLTFIQLHGDEPPEYLLNLGDRPVMRAFRFGQDAWAPVIKYMEQCRRLQRLPCLTLIDALAPGQYGGTGRTPPWEMLKGYPPEPWYPPLVLAGGLTAENVAEAIQIVKPSAVDVSSGVESSPGKKDHRKMAAFINEARKGLGVGGRR